MEPSISLNIIAADGSSAFGIFLLIDAVVVCAERFVAGVSWPAIVAGAVAACAMTLLLLAFGTGLGLSMVLPWSGAGVSATASRAGTGVLRIVTYQTNLLS
jgi:hypothetical protein